MRKNLLKIIIYAVIIWAYQKVWLINSVLVLAYERE